jgi:UDP:flavonoid glycosyltransferase YjiC (YdhE family)
MALAVRAGIPLAAFPFMADQFENQKQIVRLGIGPKTVDFKKMTSESLSAAILECISNEQFRQNASALALKLKDADGVGMTLSIIEGIQ